MRRPCRVLTATYLSLIHICRLIERFGFTLEQTTAILEMKLRRLTGLERDKIQEELDGLRRAIAYYEDLLAQDVYKRQLNDLAQAGLVIKHGQKYHLTELGAARVRAQS